MGDLFEVLAMTAAWLGPALAVANVIAPLAVRHRLRVVVVGPDYARSGHGEVLCVGAAGELRCAACGEVLTTEIAGTHRSGDWSSADDPPIVVRAICADCMPGGEVPS